MILLYLLYQEYLRHNPTSLFMDWAGQFCYVPFCEHLLSFIKKKSDMFQSLWCHGNITRKQQRRDLIIRDEEEKAAKCLVSSGGVRHGSLMRWPLSRYTDTIWHAFGWILRHRRVAVFSGGSFCRLPKKNKKKQDRQRLFTFKYYGMSQWQPSVMVSHGME